MGFLQTISGLWPKDAQMDSDTIQGSSFHGREGWGNKGFKLQERESSILLGVPTRILTVGFLWRGKMVKRTSGCGAREHVKRQSVNNKKDKTFFKASKTIYTMCILQDLERSGRTTTWQDGRRSWNNKTWSWPHQCWEACQTIQNTPLCSWFRHNVLAARQPMSTI